MSSDLDSDLDLRDFNTPSLQDQIEDLQHFICDLTRKLGNMEDRVIQNQDSIYRLEVKFNNQIKFNTKLLTFFIYLFTIVLLLLFITLIDLNV